MQSGYKIGWIFMLTLNEGPKSVGYNYSTTAPIRPG